MRLAACAQTLEPREVDLIHAAMLRIVSEVGMKIQNDAILERLAHAGAQIDRQAQVAKIPPKVVEHLIADSTPVDWSRVEPLIAASAGIFLGRYLDPEYIYRDAASAMGQGDRRNTGPLSSKAAPTIRASGTRNPSRRAA